MTNPQRTPPSVLESTAEGVCVRVKVVSGSSRTQVSGTLGDRLKVAVAAPPEGGKANRALVDLLAGLFGVPCRDVRVVSGHTGAQKSIEVTGLDLAVASQRLARCIDSSR